MLWFDAFLELLTIFIRSSEANAALHGKRWSYNAYFGPIPINVSSEKDVPLAPISSTNCLFMYMIRRRWFSMFVVPAAELSFFRDHGIVEPVMSKTFMAFDTGVGQ